MTLTYLSENAQGGPATAADAMAWANNFGQDGMVLTGGPMDIWYPFGIDQGGGQFSIALPGTIFVGPNMKIAKMGAPSNQEIEIVLSSID